jgi:hypothetical protein
VTEPVLTLRLSPDAVEALALACTWLHGEIAKLAAGRPCEAGVRLLYEGLGDPFAGEPGFDACAVQQLMRHHAAKLETLGRKLDHAHEVMCGHGEVTA